MSAAGLMKVWWVLQDAAQNLAEKYPRRAMLDGANVKRWGLVTPLDRLAAIVADCCGISAADAKRPLDFLVFDQSKRDAFRKGLWSMPVVKVGGGQVAVCLPVLAVGSPVRSIEHWLDRGGATKELAGARRGTRY